MNNWKYAKEHAREKIEEYKKMNKFKQKRFQEKYLQILANDF